MMKREQKPFPEPHSLTQLIEELEPISENPKASTLIVCFPGMGLRMGMSWVAFKESVKALPAQVVVTQNSLSWWRADNGVLAGGADNKSAADARALLHQRWPHGHLVCMGTSFGATVAVMAGSLLRAERVLAFAPVTFYGPWRRLRYGDLRWANMKALRRSSVMRKIRCDLRRITKKPAYGELSVIADQQDRLDAWHTKRLADDPGVNIHWQRGGGHNIIRAMYRKGSFSPLMADMIAGKNSEAAKPKDQSKVTRKNRKDLILQAALECHLEKTFKPIF